ncbi:unnamed protein product [Amoebophrya sp. A120]|nr:unnamed protein product [Amoebophrya sp. A120]|eukprot:GSA120T00024926001.1
MRSCKPRLLPAAQTRGVFAATWLFVSGVQQLFEVLHLHKLRGAGSVLFLIAAAAAASSSAGGIPGAAIISSAAPAGGTGTFTTTIRRTASPAAAASSQQHGSTFYPSFSSTSGTQPPGVAPSSQNYAGPPQQERQPLLGGRTPGAAQGGSGGAALLPGGASSSLPLTGIVASTRAAPVASHGGGNKLPAGAYFTWQRPGAGVYTPVPPAVNTSPGHGGSIAAAAPSHNAPYHAAGAASPSEATSTPFRTSRPLLGLLQNPLLRGRTPGPPVDTTTSTTRSTAKPDEGGEHPPTCAICLSETENLDFTGGAGCTHLSCPACLERLAEIAIKNQEPLVCPICYAEQVKESKMSNNRGHHQQDESSPMGAASQSTTTPRTVRTTATTGGANNSMSSSSTGSSPVSTTGATTVTPTGKYDEDFFRSQERIKQRLQQTGFRGNLDKHELEIAQRSAASRYIRCPRKHCHGWIELVFGVPEDGDGEDHSEEVQIIGAGQRRKAREDHDRRARWNCVSSRCFSRSQEKSDDEAGEEPTFTEDHTGRLDAADSTTSTDPAVILFDHTDGHDDMLLSTGGGARSREAKERTQASRKKKNSSCGPFDCLFSCASGKADEYEDYVLADVEEDEGEAKSCSFRRGAATPSLQKLELVPYQRQRLWCAECGYSFCPCCNRLEHQNSSMRFTRISQYLAKNGPAMEQMVSHGMCSPHSRIRAGIGCFSTSCHTPCFVAGWCCGCAPPRASDRKKPLPFRQRVMSAAGLRHAVEYGRMHLAEWNEYWVRDAECVLATLGSQPKWKHAISQNVARQLQTRWGSSTSSATSSGGGGLPPPSAAAAAGAGRANSGGARTSVTSFSRSNGHDEDHELELHGSEKDADSSASSEDSDDELAQFMSKRLSIYDEEEEKDRADPANYSCKSFAEKEKKWRRWVASLQETDEDIMRAVREWHADEARKEQVCRLCPNCGRLIERLEGCDNMRCGGSAYRPSSVKGGVGCGHAFKWSEAKQYRRRKHSDGAPRFGISSEAVRQHRKKSIFGRELDANKINPNLRHYGYKKSKIDKQRLDPNNYQIRCRQCLQPVVGPLFHCLNFPKFTQFCCFDCVVILVKSPDPDPGSAVALDPGQVVLRKDHCFEVFFQEFGSILEAEERRMRKITKRKHLEDSSELHCCVWRWSNSCTAGHGLTPCYAPHKVTTS